MLNTRITDTFGPTFPVMSAPMSRHSGGHLAGAVKQAGRLGLFGIGFISHLIPVFPVLFERAIAERLPVIAFSFGDPSPWVSRSKDSGATVICQVQPFDAAAQAVAAGTDILVVQKNEAGERTGRSNLLPLLLRVLQDCSDLPVLAADEECASAVNSTQLASYEARVG